MASINTVSEIMKNKWSSSAEVCKISWMQFEDDEVMKDPGSRYILLVLKDIWLHYICYTNYDRSLDLTCEMIKSTLKKKLDKK